MSIVNLAAYKFVSLDDLPTLRARVLERAEALALKGTVLLAPEGINLFLAGPREAVDAFMAWLRGDARFADLAPKESLSDTAPFGRLRVRLKKEIITLRTPAIRPGAGRAPAVDAATLKRWLDQGHDDDGREVLLLDTRNDYETDVGKFPQALDYRLPRFTALPAAVAADRARYEGKTVVSYCTGGIRCEKAALHLRAMGIDNVLQLDGGILKYFEDTGGAHWEGSCFVFDDRGAVGPDLLPLPSTPQRPLPSGERAGVRGQSCNDTATKLAPINVPASTRPSSDPSGHLLPAGEKEKTNPHVAVTAMTHDLPPLPSGERVGVRGQSCDSAATRPAPINTPASTRPSPDPSGHLLPAGEKGTSCL